MLIGTESLKYCDESQTFTPTQEALARIQQPNTALDIKPKLMTSQNTQPTSSFFSMQITKQPPTLKLTSDKTPKEERMELEEVLDDSINNQDNTESKGTCVLQ